MTRPAPGGGPVGAMLWQPSHRADPRALPLADRHYNRQKPGTPQFMPPGRCLVLLTAGADALWGSSWPFAAYVRHAWAGAWLCTLFRNESAARASTLIRQAVAATCWAWGPPPPLGMVTFINPACVRPTPVHGTLVWGWTYRQAGWVDCGETAGGLLALQLLPAAMPDPVPPAGAQLRLWEAA